MGWLKWNRKSGWKQIEEHLDRRYDLLEHSGKRLADMGIEKDSLLKLSVTDVFVEKAQRQLTLRARTLAYLGVLVTASMIGLLLTAAWKSFHLTLAEMLSTQQATKDLAATNLPPLLSLDGKVLTILIIKTITVGGLVGGAVYYLGALARALFHESTVLYSRRHALRFGRLSVYLKQGNVDPETLQKMFRWSDEFGSAFADIKAEATKSTVIEKALDIVPGAIEKTTKLVEAAKK